MIYLSNVNGDWWELSSNQILYVLDTDKLSQEQVDEIEEEWGGFENDKFEDVIHWFGDEFILNKLVGEV